MTDGGNALVNVSVSDNAAVDEDTISVNATNNDTDTTYTLVSNGAVEMGETVDLSNFTDGNDNQTEYVNLSVPLPEGDYTIGASADDVNSNSNSTTELGNGFDVDLGVSLDPASVVAGQETTVNATLSNVPDGASVNYALLSGGDQLQKTGSTSSDSFSVTSLFGSGAANYTVAVSPDISATELNVSNNDGYANVSVTQGNYISDLSTTPETPVYNDTITVSGTLMNSSTGSAATGVTLNFQNGGGSNISVSTTGSQGNFEFSDVTVADAGNYSIVNASNTSLETVSVGSADASVSLSVEETNLKGFENNYTVTAASDTGAPLTEWTSGSAGNYLNVTGPFSGTSISSDNIVNGTLLNTATPSGNTSYFHVKPDTGNVTFNATPTTNTSEVTVTLENNESDTAAGYEVEEPANTTDTLDLTGSAELATQESDQALFVTGVPSKIAADGSSQSVSATVVGSDNKAPEEGNALANATVSLTGPGIDVDSKTINGSSSDGTVDFNVFPSEAGTATLTVEAYSTEQKDYITETVNVTVTGDNYTNLTPTSAEVGDNSTVSVQILKDGTPQNNRNVTFTAENDVFNVSETSTAFSTLTIDAAAGEAKFGTSSDRNASGERSINTNDGIYAVEGVSFENTGTVDLNVSSPSGTTVNATGAISVTGVDVYDITSDAPNGQLLASQEQTVQFNVTRDGERVNGSDLTSLSSSLSAKQDGESITVSDVSTINTTGNSDVDTIEANLTVPSADSDVNVSVSESGQRGEATYGVVAPAVSTNMTADSFTEATDNGPVNVTVTDPRTGDVIPSAELQITAHNISANVSGSSTSYTTPVNENGSVVITVTPDVVGEDPASIEFATNASGGTSSYVTAMNVSVGEITTGAPESVAPDTQTSTTFVVRGADGNGLEGRTITLTGAGLPADKSKDTDSDGVVDFTFTPNTGTVNINVTNALTSNEVTVDTINARQQVALSLTAHDLPAYEGDSVSFELNRGDVSDVSVKGTLTVYNASDDVVKTTSITGTQSVQFNESGDYTVVASKNSTDSKSFVNASANVTIQGYTNALITADPTTNNTTSTHTVTLPVTADAAGDSLNGIEIDYSAGESATDVSEVGTDNIQSVMVSGDGVSVQEASTSNNGHTLQLSFTGDTQLQQGDVVEIVYDDAQNPASAGDYEVTGSLNYQSDPVNAQSMTLSITNATSAAPVLVGDNPAQDLDGDGTYEDINGDGTIDTVDVQALFANLDAASGNEIFDINGDGTVDTVDVQALFASL